MKYRRLGRTGLTVSEIALGTVELGMEYGIPAAGAPEVPSEKNAGQILNRALDWGINFIDTARAYGTSEEIIGRALKSRRNNFVLASKVQCNKTSESRNGHLRDVIRLSVHQSLKALRTEVIDLLQIHSAPVEVIRQGEAAGILQELQKAGCVRFIGVTVYGEEAAMEAIEAGTYDCIQIAYNALDREPECRVLPKARERDIAIIARSVLLKGALTYRHQYLPEALSELKSILVRAAAVAEARAMSLPEVAFRFVLRQPAVSTALVGATSLEELEAAITFSGRGPLPGDIEAEIAAINKARREQLNPGNWPIP